MALPISVVIPTYNRGDLLEAALRSVAAQTPEPPAEVIVVDDHSAEDLSEVTSRFDVRVIRHEVNQGEAQADNTGIAAATQPWIALLDSDDEWTPNCLDSLWRHREGHVLIAGRSVAFGDGPSVGRVGLPATTSPYVLPSPAALVFPENFVAASGVLVARDAVRAAGAFNTSLKDAVDLDLWLRLLEQGTGLIVPDVVVRYRVHAGQATSNRDRTMRAHEAVLTTYAERPWYRPELVEAWRALVRWDDLRKAIRERRWVPAARSAVWIARRPQVLPKLARVMVDRRAQRGMSARLAQSG